MDENGGVPEEEELNNFDHWDQIFRNLDQKVSWCHTGCHTVHTVTVERRIKGRIRSSKLFAAFVLQPILLHIRFLKRLLQNSPSPVISNLLSPYFY